VQRISPSNLLLLKAALLDGDAAIAAYRAWRPTLDLETISDGQQRLLPLLQSNLTRLGIEDPLADRFRGIRRYFWLRNLKAMAFAQRVFAALDQIGVPFIASRGQLWSHAILPIAAFVRWTTSTYSSQRTAWQIRP